jgi:hypothetical protein
MLQAYLIHKGLLFQRRSRGQTLQSPSQQDIVAFERHNIGGPNIEAPLLNWTAPLSSSWNRELIHLLASEIQPQIQAVEITPLPAFMTDKLFIAKEIKKKFTRPRAAFRKRLPPPPWSTETTEAKALRIEKETALEAKMTRRRGRRNGVSVLPSVP